MKTRQYTATKTLYGPTVEYADGKLVAGKPLNVEHIIAAFEQLNADSRNAFLCVFAHDLTVAIRALLLDRPVSETDLDRVWKINEFMHQLTSCANPRGQWSAGDAALLVRAIIDASFERDLDRWNWSCSRSGGGVHDRREEIYRREMMRRCNPKGINMEKFTELTGVAAPLPIHNLDTDKIFPAIYLKTIKRTGLSQWLFQEIRFRADGSENPDFVLNQAPYRKAQILIGAENFGCGSSREHAPWALLDFGIRCVIAPSFADIFYNNCFKNGILPITLPKKTCDALMEDAKKGANAVMTVDLESQTITRPDGDKVHFEIDAFRRHCLLNGLDDIGLTEQKGAEIAAYEEKVRLARPWQFGMTQRGV